MFLLCGYELDAERGELWKGGERVPAREQVVRLLQLLVENRERAVSAEEIERTIWPGLRISPGSVSNLVFEARGLLGDDGRAQKAIRTWRARGYQLVAQVDEPLGGSGRAGRARHFVGRESEMARLEADFDACCRGRLRIALVTGEPGIGKTCVVEEFVERSARERRHCVTARCSETEIAPAFWPWIQVMRSIVGVRWSSLGLSLGADTAAELSRLTSEADLHGATAVDRDTASARFRLFDAVARTLSACAALQPLVIVLEDLHRADTASLQLLDFVAEASPRSRLLIVATYRDTEPGRSADFVRAVGRLVRGGSIRVLQLRGLERAQVGELVREMLEAAPTSFLIGRLHEHTGGNPFFVQQLARLLMARGLLGADRRTLDLVTLLDPSVRETILQHLVGLSPACREMLSRASVAGREVPIALLRALAEGSAAEIEGSIREGCAARVIACEDELVRFSHVLIRDALYEGLDPAARSLLHARIARHLARIHRGAVDHHALEIAHHFYQALEASEPAGPSPATGALDPGGGGIAAQAIRFNGLAARVATGRLAYEDAVQHRAKALASLERHAPDDDMQRCDLLIELGDARMRADDRPGAAEAFARAIALARKGRDGDRLARAALGYSPGLLAIEVDVIDPYLLEMLELAVAWTPALDTPLRARLLARLATALSWTGERERRARLAAEAIAMAERLGDPGTRAFTLSARVAALWEPEDAETRAAISARAIELAREAHDPEQELVGLLHRITSLLQLGRFHAARAEMAAFAERARALRQPHATWWISLFSAHQSLMRGDFDATVAWTRAFAEEGARAHDHNAALCGPTVTAFCDGERGEVQRAFEGMSRAVIFQSSSPAAARRATLAVYAAWAGDTETAKEAISAFIHAGLGRIQRDMMWIHTAGCLAEAAATVADEKCALALYPLLLPLEGQFVVSGLAVMVWRPISYLLGRLAAASGEHARACTHFARATRECENAGMLPALVFTHRAHAKALLRSGDRAHAERAKALRQEAAALAQRLGIAHLHALEAGIQEAS